MLGIRVCAAPHIIQGAVTFDNFDNCRMARCVGRGLKTPPYFGGGTPRPVLSASSSVPSSFDSSQNIAPPSFSLAMYSPLIRIDCASSYVIHSFVPAL